MLFRSIVVENVSAAASDLAPASEPTAEAAEAAAAPEIEESLIEVWRPQRQHQRRDNNRQRQNNRHEQKQGNNREPMTAAPAGADQNRRHGKKWQNFGQAPPAKTADSPAETTAQADVSARGREDAADRREFSQGNGKPRQGRRNDERRERRHGSATSPEKGASRERLPDPNSPFAKLLVLKQQLENQGSKT